MKASPRRRWTPRRILSRVGRLAGLAPRTSGFDREQLAYAHRLLDEFHRFIAGEYGARALSRDAFLELFWRHQRSGIIRPANRFIGDLWYLFAPDFTDRLDEYYKNQELQLTMTFLAYAASPSVLADNYIEPYRLMRERVPRARVLEVGAGLPHGFLNLLWEAGPTWCESLTVVELDAIYTRFTAWACRTHDLPFHHILAHAGRPPAIPRDRPFDLVFAKDVFEHLDDPRRTLHDILAAAARRSMLALDLDDKGAVEYQHISPDLDALKDDVTRAGFQLLARTGHMSVFARE